MIEVEESFQLLQRMQRELEEKNQQLELLNQIGSLLVSDLDLEKIVQNVTDIATKVSKAQFGAFFYTKEQGRADYGLYALSGASKEDFSHFPKLPNTPLLAYTFKEKQVVRSNDITQDPRYGMQRPHHGVPKGHLPIKSYMALPVVAKSGQVFGALFFGHPEAGVFTQQEENMVLSIAAQAAVAIDSAYLHEAKLQEEQQKSLKQIHSVLESITDGFFALDKNWNVTYWNKEAERVTKVKREAILDRNLWEVFDKTELNRFDSALQISMLRGKPLHFKRFFSFLNLWLEINTYPSENGISVYLRDVTKGHRAEQLEHLEKKVLEMASKPENTLDKIILYYLTELEEILPGVRAAVCRAEVNRIFHLAAPQLPATYIEAVNGLELGPLNGSCGAAGFLKTKVIVHDIAHDEKWTALRDMALSNNLKACWSVPLLGANQKVLGTFAIYLNDTRFPTCEEDAWLDKAGRLIQLILENKLNEVALRESNERYYLATAATHDAIWDLDIATGRMYKGPGYERIFGHTDKEEQFSFDLISRRMHPHDLARVKESFSQMLEDKEIQKWQIEYRSLKADGEYAYVVNRGNIIRDAEGKAVRIVGAIQDVTEQKLSETEREMLIQELQQTNADLKQFSYITSHKLRAPLSNLLVITNLLKTESIEDPVSKMLVEKFKESTVKLNNTLNDLLYILVIKNYAGMKQEEVNLLETWQQVSQSCQQQLEESNAALLVDFSETKSIKADASYVYSILHNLLTNAIKFRSPNRDLLIEVTSKITEQFVEVRIKDNGLGIDLERYRDRLFGLYQRFHYHDSSKGLGLYTTQSQIKAMGGNIYVESEVDKGTTFIIQFKQH